MDSFRIELAGRTVEINPRCPYIIKFCKEYITDRPAGFSIITTDEDIAYERERSRLQCERDGVAPWDFREEDMELLSVYRKIADKFVDWDILLFHGSAIALDGEAYLFTALSGTGKSTHTRLWRERFGNRAFMVNDDKPLLRLTEEGVFVCGTPWNGKHNLSTNIQVPLKAICYLQRDSVNRIERTDGRELMPILFQQCYRPEDPEKMLKVMKLVERISKSVQFYRLGCNMEPEAAEISCKGMGGKLS